MKSKIILAVLIFLFVLGVTAVVRLTGTSNINLNNNNQLDNPSEPLGIPPQDTPNNSDDNQNSGITSSQLSLHDSESDCWIAYNGKVYDITSYLPRHPGGKNRILPFCGSSQDFTQAFTNQHGTSKVSLLMKVGVLIGDFDIKGNLS